MSIHVNFGGRYRLQVFHGNTDILKYDTGWFSNIITDNGLNLLGTGFSPSCFVGTNGAPGAAGDTAITNPVGAGMGELSEGNQITALPYYGWKRYTAAFAIGAVVGTIAEVGVGQSATNLFSRAQLLDVNGTPVTLTLGGIDRLTITYELRQYFDIDDQAFSVTVDGVATSGIRRILIRTLRAPSNSMNPTLGRPAIAIAGGSNASGFYTSGTTPFIGGDIYTVPSGTFVVANYYVAEQYVPGEHKNTAVIGLTSAQGIVSNITAVAVSVYDRWGPTWQVNGGDWQFSLDPPISKTQYEDLRLTFETSWGRA